MAAFNAVAQLLGGVGINAAASFFAREEADDAAREATEFLTGDPLTAASDFGAAIDARGDAARDAAALRVGGFQAARQSLEGSLEAANLADREALERGLEFIDPELQSARGAQTLLDDAIGVNGPEAQARFFADFENDPGFQAEVDAALQAQERQASASGRLTTGAQRIALADRAQRFQRGAFSDRLNRLRDRAGLAVDIAGRGAGFITTEGARRAGRESTQGVNLARLDVGAGEAEATGLEDRARFLAEGQQVRSGARIDVANALARESLQRGRNQVQFINNLASTGQQALGQLDGAGFNALARRRIPTDAAGRVLGGV